MANSGNALDPLWSLTGNSALEEFAQGTRPVDATCLSLMRIARRSLIASSGVHEGFRRYRQLVSGLPGQAEIHFKRLAGLRETASADPGTFHQIFPSGEAFTVPAPAVVGEGIQRALLSHARSMFVACLTNARVRARSNIIETQGRAVLDYQDDELTRFDDLLDIDPAVFEAVDDGAWVVTPEGDAASVELDEAFTLLGRHATNFGHWLSEYMPKYIAADLSGVLPPVPVLIDAGMPQTHRQALEQMLHTGAEIIELAPLETARVRRLWCASGQIYFPEAEVYNERFRWEYFALPPTRFAPIIREMARRLEGATARPTGIDRVFLAREHGLAHQMENHEAIEAAARARGFSMMYPRQLSFIDQARLLRHARYVVGQAGSAMFLGYFAQPGTKLCMLCYVEDVLGTQADLSGILSTVGLDITLLTGRCAHPHPSHPYRSSFEIDEGQFCRFLDRWIIG